MVDLEKRIVELEVQLDAAVRLKNEAVESRDYFKKQAAEWKSGFKREKEVLKLYRDIEYWKDQNYRTFNMLKGTKKDED